MRSTCLFSRLHGIVLMLAAVLYGAAPAAAELPLEEKCAGFVSLFDGKTLEGWIGAMKGYTVEEGNLICLKDGGGNLYTKDEYSDFIYRFEFKLEAGANNGLGIRTPPMGDAAYVGMELQILDDTSDKYANLKPYQYHGSIYGVVPAKRGHLKPVGEWNSQEVIANGNHITVKLNGETIVDADIAEASKDGTIDGRPHPGLLNKQGHIGYLGHGARIEFRNIRIKDLTKEVDPAKIDPACVTQTSHGGSAATYSARCCPRQRRSPLGRIFGGLFGRR